MVEALSPRADPTYRPLVGFEFEILLFDRATLTPLQMKGERGLEAVMRRAKELTAATPLPGQPDKKLALPDGAYLSLEPGGQFEFSSPPLASYAAVEAQLQRFVGL